MSYKRLDQEDFLISAESITTSAWSGNVPELTSFFTSSTQVSSSAGDFYVNVYESDPALTASAEIQFTLGYGNIKGSGSLLYTNDPLTDGKSPTSTVYGQMRTLILGDEEASFKFTSGSTTYTPESIYVITLDRGRYKQRIRPGSFELTISGTPNVVLKDNSTSTTVDTFTDAGRVYEILKDGTSESESGSYGKIYPDVGIAILNADAMEVATDVNNSNRGSNVDVHNALNLYDVISSFKASSEETVSSNFVFARARNSEFNYTTNPSYITGSGEIIHEELINSPETFITTVGMYNDNQDLLAVAKLSRPLLKNSTKEALIRVKLDY